MKTVEDVQYSREMLEFEVDAFLRKNGWKHTSQTPGCLWRWQKEINGRVFVVNKETALAIQAHADMLNNIEETGDTSE